jgi:hypothetical protein
MIPVSDASRRTMRKRLTRIAWMGGRRGELLMLAPLFSHFRKTFHNQQMHWLIDAAEDGMASSQAMDYLQLVPDETSDLCHPADETAVRIRMMMDRSESFMRHCKADAAVFGGCGSMALAASICCMARRCRGLWIKPSDPAGVLERFVLESRYQKIIRASFPGSDVMELDYHVPAVTHPDEVRELEPVVEIPGYRENVPRLLVHVQRKEWNIKGNLSERLARTIAVWARNRPGGDYLVLGNLNACTERPMRIQSENLGNYMIAPPLPYPLYLRLMKECRVVLTDSPLVASEALAHGKPLVVLGELPGAAGGNSPGRGIHHITPDGLGADADPLDLMDTVDVASGQMRVHDEFPGTVSVQDAVIERIEDWICRLEPGVNPE